MMNAHQVLGVSATASKDTIKNAYRKLAQKYHPDKNKEANAESTFVLIKEAYGFLITGKSNSGVFTKPKPTTPKPAAKVKPAPKPAQPKPEDHTVWQTGYGAKNVDKVELLVTYSEAFTGAHIKIPNSPFTTYVRPGVQHCQKERRLLRSQAGFEAYMDIEFKLYDPIGFYKLQSIAGFIRFCCHLEMTSGQILSGFTHAIKNLNPTEGPILITVPADHRYLIRIPNAGIKLSEDGTRSDLYVIPIVKFIPIEQEIQPVLVALNKKVQEALKAYNDGWRSPRVPSK